MDRALLASATGMAAQQRALDTIASNLANADVAGFKGSVELFGDLANGTDGALGTTSLGTRVRFEQGKLVRGGGPFDVAIDGPGFFTVADASGNVRYTRDGSFSRTADGTLENAGGLRLRGVRVPDDALSLRVENDGTVRATFAKGETREVGRIALAVFPAPDRLRAIDGTTFVPTAQSGRARNVVPGAQDGPKLRFGMLERSNVSIVESMMQILNAQRAYEANAKGVQAADEMLRIANNLQRG